MTETSSGARRPDVFEQIAHVCNEANRAFSEENGDFSNPRWEDVEDWRRSFETDGAKLILGGGSPEDLHDLWRGRKQNLGWQHAATRDPVAKTTPAMVPYAQLTDIQKKKNLLFAAVAQVVGCGAERWDVKTLTDPSATKVNMTPQPSTIAALTAIPAPANPPSRVYPEEFTTYQLEGSITLAKRELDSDIHMVLADGANPPNHMIIEAPCPSLSLVLASSTGSTDKTALPRMGSNCTRSCHSGSPAVRTAPSPDGTLRPADTPERQAAARLRPSVGTGWSATSRRSVPALGGGSGRSRNRCPPQRGLSRRTR